VGGENQSHSHAEGGGGGDIKGVRMQKNCIFSLGSRFERAAVEAKKIAFLGLSKGEGRTGREARMGLERRLGGVCFSWKKTVRKEEPSLAAKEGQKGVAKSSGGDRHNYEGKWVWEQEGIAISYKRGSRSSKKGNTLGRRTGPRSQYHISKKSAKELGGRH